ncbi:MAG: ABC transporter ATP-binding protein/permease [Anaerolineae bacterium]|nr:ABC transporter ATP-binding protein/permease [Anaerolineae bacterium]
MRSLLRLPRYLRRHWRSAVGAYVSLVVVTASNLVMPSLVRYAIDLGIGSGRVTLLLWIALGIVAVACVRAVFAFLQGYLSERASQGVAFDLRNALYDKIQRLSFSYHDRTQTGQLMTRATSDVETVRFFCGMGLLQLTNTVVMTLGTSAILFVTDWRLALLSLSITPLLLVVVVRFSRKVHPIFMGIQQELARLNTILQENLVGVRVVKAFAREPFERQRFGQQNLTLFAQNLRASRAFATVFPIMNTLSGLGTLFILWYGGRQVAAGQLSLGQLVAFNTYLLLLLMPLRMLGPLLGLATRASASAQRVFEILDAPLEISDAPHARPLPPIKGRVAFENVSFAYFSGQKVLDGVSFVAEPGQVVALLGATGSGKTTIINLIPRFYDATEGRVTIDGYDVRDVTLESLRRQIGIVLQESMLFGGTIRENIAFGVPDASLDDIIAVAKAAHAHDFIMSFPQGYDTPVGERGVTLSGGQRQRIAIARALLLDPRILILDDSTSSVDVETEYQIQQALRTLMKGRTSFVIAQRLSTVRHADLILVLDRGRLVARGTHEELIRESGIYAEIYDLQLRQGSQPAAEAGPSEARAPGPDQDRKGRQAPSQAPAPAC